MAADAEPSLHNSEETSGNAPTHTQSDSGASKPVSSSLSNGASGPAEASETHEGFSITQAACLAARRRQSILDEWAQDRRQQRHARIPVPTPEELSDTGVAELSYHPACFVGVAFAILTWQLLRANAHPCLGA